MTVPVSVIVVSRGRPSDLRRCLTSLVQLDYHPFEIVVVADPAGLAATAGFPVTSVAFDRPNISDARNAGIAAARGQVVAFIDDDAAAEPHWLTHLAAPFVDPAVDAAGGFVVGANGISLEWAGGTVDRNLVTGALDLRGADPEVHGSSPERCIEIKGVNCAYRRATVARAGGFDPNLAYYLDETELNLRLAAQGARVAAVPRARVHHAKAASRQRRADRAPLSLRDVGISTAVTLRRHGEISLPSALADLLAHERRKLLEWMISGKIEPGDVNRLIAGLIKGFHEGAARRLAPLPAIAGKEGPFGPVPSPPRPAAEFFGRPWQARDLCRRAGDHVRAGGIARVVVLSPTAFFHRVRFMPEGYWLQTGGLFGKSLRSDPVFRFWNFSDRCTRERDMLWSGWRKT